MMVYIVILFCFSVARAVLYELISQIPYFYINEVMLDNKNQSHPKNFRGTISWPYSDLAQIILKNKIINLAFSN